MDFLLIASDTIIGYSTTCATMTKFLIDLEPDKPMQNVRLLKVDSLEQLIDIIDSCYNALELNQYVELNDDIHFNRQLNTEKFQPLTL
jgi:hypothetical protein